MSERDLEAVKANLASLNDIVAELVAKVSGDPAFVEFTTGLLAGHSDALGYRLNAPQAIGEGSAADDG